jgi:hypothetical protein
MRGRIVVAASAPTPSDAQSAEPEESASADEQ